MKLLMCFPTRLLGSEGSWFTCAEVGGAVSAAEIPSVNLLLAIDVLQSRTRAHSLVLQLRYSLQYTQSRNPGNNIRHQWP